MLRSKSTLAWAEKHLAIWNGSFNRNRLPMLIEPLETIDRHPGKNFVIQASVQSVKTLLMQLRAARNMMVCPTKSLWYSPSREAVKEFADEKFIRLIDECPTLQAMRYNDRHKVTKAIYQFPGGSHLMLLSAGIESNRNSKTGCEIYIDEPWLNGPGWNAAIKDRKSSFRWQWRVIQATSGPTKGSEADQDWQASDQRIFEVKCPICDDWIYLDFGDGQTPHGLKYETGESAFNPETEEWNFKAVRASVHYVCQRCGEKIPYTPTLLDSINRQWRYTPVNDNADGTTFGWHYQALNHYPWPDLAVEWIKANKAKRQGNLTLLENFVRKRKAKRWSLVEQMKPKSKEKPLGTYAMGEPWDDVAKDDAGRPWRFMTVDVQARYFYCVIRDWSEKAETRLVWVEKCYSEGELVALQLAHKVVKTRVALDSGDNQESRVYRLCGKYGWLAMQGTSKRSYYNPEDGCWYIYSQGEVRDGFLGTNLQGQRAIIEILFSHNSASNHLHELREARDSQDNRLWTIAQDTPQYHQDQIDGNILITTKNPQDESTQTRWVRVEEDHGFDAEKMQIPFAAMAGLITGEVATDKQTHNDEEGT